MLYLTKEQIEIIRIALELYATEQEQRIREHYLDLDHEELVDPSSQTIEKVSQILPYFNGSRPVYMIKVQQ